MIQQTYVCLSTEYRATAYDPIKIRPLLKFGCKIHVTICLTAEVVSIHGAANTDRKLEKQNSCGKCNPATWLDLSPNTIPPFHSKKPAKPMTASMKTHSCQRMAGMSCNVVEIKSAAKRMACAAITMVRVPSPTIHPQRHSLGPVSPLQGISTDFFSFDKISITAIAAKKQTQMIFVCRNVVATIATYAKYKLRLGPCVISGKLLQHAYQTREPIALFFHEHVCQKDKKS